MAHKVFVGLSGGVDSSVAAALLKQQGYDVTGVFMKNWSKDLPGFDCPWQDDFQDAKRVAVQLNIPFKLYDFEQQYRHKVVDYMVAEYKNGRTPNPDIVCNQEIKFKLFLQMAQEDGADMIATGHYARSWSGKLYMANNSDKDQTFFLYRVSKEALRQALFPIGKFKTKEEVRRIAEEIGLITAQKKDSMGICFIGKVGIKEFLVSELGEQEPGEIIDQNGQNVGQHDGAIFYTIGQRHGLAVGGGLPYYVIGKDMTKNQIFVTTNLDDDTLWAKTIRITDVHWIGQTPKEDVQYQVRTRHRAPLVPCSVKSISSAKRPFQIELTLNNELRAVTAGQSAVIYNGQQCLGGGIIVGR